MKVSVIIANYNGRSFVSQCIDSVLKSGYPNFEVVVVDNASTDGSHKYLVKKYNKNKKVKIIRSDKQLYFTGGSNLGAKKAQGEKLILLNSDTVIDKNCIKELVAFTKDQPKYLAQPKILFYNQKNTIDNVGGKYNFFGFGSAIGRDTKDQGQHNKNSRVDYANGTCFMIDKKFFEKLGGFDEWFKYFYGDVDLNLRAQKAGGESWYCHRSAVYHKGSLTFKKNVTEEKLIFYIRRNRLRTIIKNFTGWGRFLRLLLLFTIYGLLLTQDLFSFKRKRMFLTLNSIWAVANLEIKYLIERLRLWELKKFVKQKKFSLLDIGCGQGVLVDLANLQGIKAIGVDADFHFNPKIIHSSFKKLKIKQKFDVITMIHFLEHAQNPKKVLAKTKRLLEKSGTLVVEVPLVSNLTEKLLGKDYFAYHDKTHLHFFSKEEIINFLNKAGFRIKRKGFTLFEFPLTVLTSSFKRGFLGVLLGTILFLPLKFLSTLGLNDEIIRFYCQQK